MPWPKEVDVLTARNIHKGDCGYTATKRCRTGAGWILHWFGIGSECYEALHVILEIIDPNQSIVVWAAGPNTSKSDIAKALNQMTAKLGYTEGNPEA